MTAVQLQLNLWEQLKQAQASTGGDGLAAAVSRRLMKRLI